MQIAKSYWVHFVQYHIFAYCYYIRREQDSLPHYGFRRVWYFMAYKPEQGITARQTEKAVQRAAADFERSIEQGYALDNRQTFAEYADHVLAMKERTGVRTVTPDRYRGFACADQCCNRSYQAG